MNTIRNIQVLKRVAAASILLTCTSHTMAGSQDWTYTYNSSGQVLTADGPRTDLNDIISYTYDAAGNRASMSNALGHTTLFTNYNNRGQVGLITDANDIQTALSYHPRGWLLSSTIRAPGNTSLDATTRYTYDAEGQLLSTSLPNGVMLYNEYDAAHRLIAITNNTGERVEYTLDAAGNHLQEITRSGTQTITRSLAMAYDELNRLILLTGAGGQTTAYTYDRNGNRVSTVDGNMNTRILEYDALNQLSNALAPLNHTVGYINDAQGNLIALTDPGGLQTAYDYDGLNNLTRLSSPDTGVTSYLYDGANNRVSETDARGITTSFSYDALNRLLSVSYPTQNLNIEYRYDEGTYGKGRLTSIIDASGTTVIDYDHRGNVVYQGIDIGNTVTGLSYAYNKAQQLLQITYPSGRLVTYSRDINGLVSSASTTTVEGTQTLAENTDYLPFGPMNSLDYGNGLQLLVSYDLDYRVSQLTHTAIRDHQYNYDNVDNITGISNALDSSTDQVFAYDALNRLGTASGNYGNISYNYDANGNRLSYSDSSGVDNYTYDATSHRLLSTRDWNYLYDSNGNRSAKLSNDGSGDGLLYIYDDNNRMVEVIRRATITSGKGGHQTTEQIDSSLATYTYNASGQRARKITATQTMNYIYGLDGLLLAEVDNKGLSHREYIYLNGQPLAAVHYTYTQAPETSGPAIIMDDTGAESSSTGSWVNTRKKGAYGDYYSLSNNTGSTYRFTPSGLKNANYEVYAWWPRTNKNNKTAQFTIAHNGQNSISVQNQSTSGKQWVQLGKYGFTGDGTEYIELSDIGGKTAADGIRLVEKIPAPPPTVIAQLYYIHNDHLGTPQVFTDQSQTVVWSANYKPFGKTTVSIGNIISNIRFPGQYFDEESGLHQNYFRDYDPGLGRYVQSDPIGLIADFSNPQIKGLEQVASSITNDGRLNHIYNYSDNNPVSYVDPHGLIKISLGGSGAVFGGGAGGNAGVFFGIDTAGNFCMQIRTCVLVGGGVETGGGKSLRIGSGEFCEGEALEGGIFAEGGFGPFAAVSATNGGDGFNFTATAGAGAGAAGGGQMCLVKTTCF